MVDKDGIRAVPEKRGSVNGSQDNKTTSDNAKEAEKAFTEAKKKSKAQRTSRMAEDMKGSKPNDKPPSNLQTGNQTATNARKAQDAYEKYKQEQKQKEGK